MRNPFTVWAWTLWIGAVVPPAVVAAVYRRFPNPPGRCDGIGFGCVPPPGEVLVFVIAVGCVVGLVVSGAAILIASSKRIVGRVPAAPLLVAGVWAIAAVGFSVLAPHALLGCGGDERTPTGCASRR